MSFLRTILIGLIAAVALCGCSGKIFEKFEVDSSPPTSVSLDARQRVILATEHGGPNNNQRVVCAEPSPDAFMALAASGGANVAVAEKEVGGRAALAESAGALGPRTQTIQLLRDGLYRACEAYMNGVISSNDYRRILVAYDEILITLVALEGLGRPQLGPLPKLGAGADIEAEGAASAASTTTADAQGSAGGFQLEAEAAKQIHAIVRDYFCLQIGFKELFSTSDSTFNPDILLALCGAGGSE